MKTNQRIQEFRQEIARTVIYEHFIVCLECGKKFWSLTDEHLAHHGLDMQEYRERHGYDSDIPLTCKSLSRTVALAVGM